MKFVGTNVSSMFVGMAILASVACSRASDIGVACPAIFVYGLNVTVVDSITGAPTGSGATVVARDGAYTDSSTRAANGSAAAPFALAGERSGTYSLTVRKSGYTDWLKSGIQVKKAVCGVTPVVVLAKLQPGS